VPFLYRHARQPRPDDIYSILIVPRVLLLCSQFAAGVALVICFALSLGAEMSKLLAATAKPPSGRLTHAHRGRRDRKADLKYTSPL
jgi:hypothetical protein